MIYYFQLREGSWLGLLCFRSQSNMKADAIWQNKAPRRGWASRLQD